MKTRFSNKKSAEVFEKSLSLIPGGVNSPVRAFKAVGGVPFIAKGGQGPWLFDIDDQRNLDYVMSWGPLILGHSFKPVVDAVCKAAQAGTSFGAPTAGELDLAILVNERMPWIEKFRLVSSGTEACMTAVRLARGATGRNIIIKFDGGYHGHSDSFLVKAGSGLATGGFPASAGVPKEIAAMTISVPYNNLKAVAESFQAHGADIAAIIAEPVAANMGVIPPADGFLEGLRKITAENGSLLIFDEVITGFRVAPGGAAGLYNIKPDLVCLGKILGGGLPIGGIGGRKEIMDYLTPDGPVYQAGTLSGNPLSTAAGIATLKALDNQAVYRQLRQYSDDLTGQIAKLFENYLLPLKVNKVESLFTLFFAKHKVIDFESAQKSDMKTYAEFFRHLLQRGIYIPPSGYETWFVSNAHTQEHLDLTIKAMREFVNA